MESSKEGILYVGFNQDYGCFACGTETGFKIYNTYPYKDTFFRDFDGGIGIAEMLFRCNILALVGGGAHPKYPPNKVMLWDDHQMRCIGELSFKSNVKSVNLRKDKVVVVLENRIYVYNFSDLKLIDAIDTCPNPRGLIALSPDKDSTVLACPDKQKGNVRVCIYEHSITNTIAAHHSSIACMALNADGQFLATASDKGTLVRIFSTLDSKILQEVRRGADKAEIYSIAFEPNSKFIAVTSDKGTAHIFALTKGGPAKIGADEDVKEDGVDHPKNSKSIFSFMKGLLPQYFGSEWSFAQYKFGDAKNICCFAPDDHLVLVSTEGDYCIVEYDPKNGGECKKKFQTKILSQE